MTGIVGNGVGVPPSGSGHSAEPEPGSTVSAVPVSVPNAAHVPYSVRAKIMRAIADPGLITTRLRTEAGLVEVLAHWQARAVLDVVLELAATSPAFASAIRRAATENTGAVHESAVAKPDAQPDAQPRGQP